MTSPRTASNICKRSTSRIAASPRSQSRRSERSEQATGLPISCSSVANDVGARWNWASCPDGELDMTDGNITKDTMYAAVAPADFASMIELDRYEQPSSA